VAEIFSEKSWRRAGGTHAIGGKYDQSHQLATGICPGFICHMGVALPGVM